MARTVTLGKLRGLARLYADQRPSDETNAFVNKAGTSTTAGLNDLINLAVAGLYDKLLKAGGQVLYRASDPISVVSGTATYALPSDFYQSLNIELNWSATDVEPVPQLTSQNDRYKYLNWNLWSSWTPKAYQLVSVSGTQSVEFVPTPTSAVTATHFYLPVLTDLSNDADLFDGVNGFEKLVALQVAMELRAIEESPFNDLMTLYEREEARIDGVIADRAAGPAQVQDVMPETGMQLPWPYTGGRVTT